MLPLKLRGKQNNVSQIYSSHFLIMLIEQLVMGCIISLPKVLINRILGNMIVNKRIL